VVTDTYLEQLVVNLGRLDWRRSSGDPSNSRLLDGIWARLKPSQEYGDPHLKAIQSVAYFQPERALAFVERSIREGHLLRQLPPILRYIAYNLQYAPAAISCLWQLGRCDDRETNPYPEHAIRILHELCQVALNKPREYIALVIDFGIRLLGDPESWKQRYSPLDFLCGILEPDGHEATSSGRTITWTNFSVSHSFAAPLRKRVIDAIIGLLSSTDSRAAYRAARHVGDAVRYPMNSGDRGKWAAEFASTLQAVAKKIKATEMPPMVLLQIVRSISWHAHYGDGKPSRVANEIIASLPSTLEFRTALALVDGHGSLIRTMNEDFAADRRRLEEEHLRLAADLARKFRSPEHLRDFLDNVLSAIAMQGATDTSPHQFLFTLLRSNPDLADTIATRALGRTTDHTRQYCYLALGVLLTARRERALTLFQAMLASGEQDLQGQVGSAYGMNDFTAPPADVDISNIKKLLQASEPRLVFSGLAALRALRAHSKLLVDLLCIANIGLGHRLADEALMLPHLERATFHALLTPGHVRAVLDKLKPLDELDGHWVEEFLAFCSREHADACARFFMDRVEHAAASENWKHRPCNHGPYGHVPLKFREAPQSGTLLFQISTWMAKPDASYLFRYRAAELFNCMFSPFDATILSHLRDWVRTADEASLGVIAHVLREGAQ